MGDCFAGKTAALLCKSQPSPEIWISLSHIPTSFYSNRWDHRPYDKT